MSITKRIAAARRRRSYLASRDIVRRAGAKYPGLSLLSIFLLAGIFASPAYAKLDSQGYIENWPGIIALQYNGDPSAGNLSAVSAALPSISSLIGTAISPQRFCGMLKTAVVNKLGATWDSCSVNPSPELRGKISVANVLSMKILFSNISFSFSVPGALGDNPKINVTANAELNLAVNFANSIDGSVATGAAFSSLPATVLSAALSFSDANVSTRNVVANIVSDVSSAFGGPSFGQLASLIDQQSLSQASLAGQTVNTLNPLLHGEANFLWTKITKGLLTGDPNDPTANDPNANELFSLAVSINQAMSLVIDFRRSGNAPVTPANCFASSLSYATVEVMCYSYSNTGVIIFDKVDPMKLERDPSVWPVVDDGVSNSWDIVPPRLAAPQFVDSSFQETPTPPQTATYRVCAYNVYGQGCTAPMVVKLNLTVQPAGSGGLPNCGPKSKPYKMCLTVMAPAQTGGTGFGPTVVKK